MTRAQLLTVVEVATQHGLGVRISPAERSGSVQGGSNVISWDVDVDLDGGGPEALRALTALTPTPHFATGVVRFGG